MANLVFLSKENIPLTTSEIIATALKKEHHVVLTLIRKYQTKIQRFGSLAFKMQVSRKDGKGGEKKTVAYLN